MAKKKDLTDLAMKIQDEVVTYVQDLADKAGAELEFASSDFDGDILFLSFDPDDLITMSSEYGIDDVCADIRKYALKGNYHVMIDTREDGFTVEISGLKTAHASTAASKCVLDCTQIEEEDSDDFPGEETVPRGFVMVNKVKIVPDEHGEWCYPAAQEVAKQMSVSVDDAFNALGNAITEGQTYEITRMTKLEKGTTLKVKEIGTGATTVAKPKADKEFHAFLKKNKVDVKDGRVKIADSHRIAGLHDKYVRESSKKSGLPQSLVPHKDKVIELTFLAPRESQKPEKYKCTLSDTMKSDDDFEGVLKGTVENLFKCLNAENWGIEAGDIEFELLEAVEQQD